MKRALFLLTMLTLFGGATAFGQDVVDAPMQFEVYSADPSASSKPVAVWYVEDAGLSDEAGVLVAAMEGGYGTLISNLENLSNDPLVTSFKLDREGRKLYISMQGVTGTEIGASIRQYIEASPKSKE